MRIARVTIRKMGTKGSGRSVRIDYFDDSGQLRNVHRACVPGQVGKTAQEMVSDIERAF